MRSVDFLHRSGSRYSPCLSKQSNITRSVDEAEQILRGHASQLGANPTPEQFAALAKDNS